MQFAHNGYYKGSIPFGLNVIYNINIIKHYKNKGYLVNKTWGSNPYPNPTTLR